MSATAASVSLGRPGIKYEPINPALSTNHFPAFCRMRCVLFGTLSLLTTIFAALLLPLSLPHMSSNSVVTVSDQKSRKVILLGDSLMNKPYNHFHLAKKIDALVVANETLDYIDAGVGGDTIRWLIVSTSLQSMIALLKVTRAGKYWRGQRRWWIFIAFRQMTSFCCVSWYVY